MAEKKPMRGELWESANLKARQLEAEIRKSDASHAQKMNMLHTLSKLTMFYTDAVDEHAHYAQRLRGKLS